MEKIVSVAFRRDSDEEHLEPRFELPIPPGPNYVTARGRRQLDEQVAKLEERVAGAEDQTARETASRELRYWHTRQVTAIDAPPPPDDEVAFGSKVLIRIGTRECVFEIVGHDEADSAEGRIAFSAPLARALIGAGEGDHVDFGGGIDVLKIDPSA